MKQLTSLAKFQLENPETEITGTNTIIGGRNDLSQSSVTTPTMTEWNCADLDRTMMWDGNANSAPFQIWEEKP